MRIAYLAHFYPPAPCGGAGHYTAVLAEAFQAAGAQPGILCVGRWGEGKQYFDGYDDDLRNSIPVRRLHVNWRKAPRPFDWLYDSPVLGVQAQAYLQDFQPDVVHVSSCYTLSTRPVLVAKEMGFPVIMHLHDYWHICPRLILLRTNDSVCSGPRSAWACQECLLEGTKAMRVTSRLMSERNRRRVFARLARIPWLTRQRGLRGMLGDVQRRREVTQAAIEAADLLVSPTRFARDILASNGVPSERMLVKPYGNQTEWAQRVRHLPSDHLRIGFLGNVIPIKGVHLLTEAHQVLVKSNHQVRLSIWGDTSLAPEYCRTLQETASREILWGGRYHREDLTRILSDIDVVVVPSIWYETQGIVIQEAFAAGLPVVVSDNSSLTETVTHEENGLHFQQGSAQDLAHQLSRLLDEPGLLDRLRRNIPAVRTIEQDVVEYTTLYTDLLKRRRTTR